MFPPECANPEERAIFVSNLEILLGQLKNQYSLNPLYTPPTSHLIRRVLERVSVAYGDPELSLETISRMLNISKRHLYRKWKECFNQSFSEYLADFRMERAAILLKESSSGVKAI